VLDPEGIIEPDDSEMNNFREQAMAKAGPHEKPIFIYKEEMVRLPAAMNALLSKA
jgi:hypothetical protein